MSGLLLQVHLVTELQRVCLSCPPPHTTPHPQNQMNLHIWLQSRLGWFTSAGVLITPQNKLIGFCTPLLVKQFSGCAYHAPPPPHPPPPEPDEFAHLVTEQAGLVHFSGCAYHPPEQIDWILHTLAGEAVQRVCLSCPPPTPPPTPRTR